LGVDSHVLLFGVGSASASSSPRSRRGRTRKATSRSTGIAQRTTRNSDATNSLGWAACSVWLRHV